MATPTDICNMAISRLGQPKINDIGENSAAAIACRDHFEPVRDALLRGHPWNFATVRADLAEGATPEYGWSRSFTLPDDFLRLNTVNGVEASRCEADYSLTFRTIYSNADTLQVTYVKQIEDTTLFDPLFVEAFVLKLAAAIAPSIADPAEKGAMEGLSASRLRDAAFADASENRSMISTTSMGAASRYYRPQAVAFDAWGPSVGIKGGDGWSPLFKLEASNGVEYVYVYDWTGGDGIAPKPATGYIGRYGIVPNIANAVGIGNSSTFAISTATTTTINGILKGVSGNIAAAVQGTDYSAAIHASTHVTGGADKIRDATASQDGLMTSAYAGKLDGIATNANNYVHKGQLGITIDGAGANITAGVKGFLRVPYNCTITKAEMVANDVGDVTVQVWKDTYAAFPPTSSDAIYGGSPPTITGNFKSTDATLSGWTTSLTEGQYLAFNVPSASTGSLYRVTLVLVVNRTS